MIEKIQEVEKFGLGELIINFVSRDGMRVGYDYNFIDKISKKIDIPIIALGGASSKEDFNKVVKAEQMRCTASSIFVFIGNRKGVVPSYKNELMYNNNNISFFYDNPVRTVDECLKQKLDLNYKVCNDCLFDSSIEGIDFDKNGTCSFCNGHKVSSHNKKEDLNQILKKLKKK